MLKFSWSSIWGNHVYKWVQKAVYKSSSCSQGLRGRFSFVQKPVVFPNFFQIFSRTYSHQTERFYRCWRRFLPIIHTTYKDNNEINIISIIIGLEAAS